MTSRWFVANDDLLVNLDNVEDVLKVDRTREVVVSYVGGGSRILHGPDIFSRLRKRLFWHQAEDEKQWATEWE
jgi:hypothetical protein